MLNKEKTANWARLKYLLAVPLGVGLLCVSTLSFSKSYGFLEIGTQKQVQQKAPKNKQEKPVYYPEHRYDEKNNFISLEKRAIIVNGKLVADKNKFFGVAEADEIKYLNTAEATKKYGEKMGKNGAVVITGKNLVSTPPPPMMPSAAPASPPKVKKGQISPPPPPIEAPPSGKKLKKFPPLIKLDHSKENAGAKQGKNQEIEIVAVPKQNEVVVQGYQASEKNQPTQKVIGTSLEIKADKNQAVVVTGYKVAQKSNKEKLKNEIEEVQSRLVEKNKLPEIEIVPVQKVKGIKLEEKNTPEKEVIITGYKTSDKNTPVKKVQGLKLTSKTTKDKTSSLKRVSNYQTQDHQKATKTKTTPQNRNNVFFKAWTLYKPKVEENKNDNC